MTVPAVHELVVTHGKRAYASRRGANKVALIDLEKQTYQDVLTLSLPDCTASIARYRRRPVATRHSFKVAIASPPPIAGTIVNSSRVTSSRAAAYSSRSMTVVGGENVNCCRTTSRSLPAANARMTNSCVRDCVCSSKTTRIVLSRTGSWNTKQIVCDPGAAARQPVLRSGRRAPSMG